MNTPHKFNNDNLYWKFKDKYLEFGKWDGVEVVVSLRGYKKEIKDSIENKAKLITGKQVHGNKVLIVSEPSDYECDGFITNKPGIYLGVSTADCMPVFIYERRNKIISLLHAGRKGTQEGILHETLCILRQNFNSDVKDISVLFGPAICPLCYEYNLWENNYQQAKDMGVTDIINPEVCTAENLDMFYSYRKERTQERMLSTICLKQTLSTVSIKTQGSSSS
ncbi:MAG: polyphenol oxidase family protein [bacterium]|nr:polyphenol oxidase family protein [bacterium]